MEALRGNEMVSRRCVTHTDPQFFGLQIRVYISALNSIGKCISQFISGKSILNATVAGKPEPLA